MAAFQRSTKFLAAAFICRLWHIKAAGIRGFEAVKPLTFEA
ncbi:hypothetical protein OEZ60_01155 [Defluviimonas sp. WL0024]|uniref:Uncharacterized protein n=1 Tax=Albidovulum salinarum TaxID=2984153 RepID=A0ABT2WY69_9RHOB|nr:MULTISPECIES: hypothetical protein [Defluviimonas]MCU9846612.1 hypothetical protein [Defluviimonas sp. WL0024]